MKILFLGDIVGRPGRTAVTGTLPKWKQEYAPDFVIANPENSAHGHGATEGTLRELQQAGVDAFTFGDHFDDEAYAKLDAFPIVRPANFSGNRPGHGAALLETALHDEILVISLAGSAFMKPRVRNFFDVVDAVIEEQRTAATKAVFVDFHAETTSEKTALGHHLDGKASAVVGTHTHVPTADEQILPGGTAYITDVGMCGALHGVLGFDAPTSQRWLRKEMGEDMGKVPLAVAENEPYVCDAVLIEADGPAKSKSIKRLTTRPQL